MSEQRAVYLATVPVDATEPADQLGAQDITVLRSALHMYYGEMAEMHAPESNLSHIARLSRRLADVSLTWIAERGQG